jgi:hypothetical protein
MSIFLHRGEVSSRIGGEQLYAAARVSLLQQPIVPRVDRNRVSTERDFSGYHEPLERIVELWSGASERRRRLLAPVAAGSCSSSAR